MKMRCSNENLKVKKKTLKTFSPPIKISDDLMTIQSVVQSLKLALLAFHPHGHDSFNA